ncbi:hypothetical protein CDO26_19995 (plasmid) [Sinorhizobium meliloti]|nr:hypothetical protein CDO26_19995 [Sinorhizobium meliloti]
MIEVNEAHIDEIIKVTKAKFGAKHRIVYVTDSVDFMRFLNQQAVFEYLPSRLEQSLHASEMAWDSYMARRWRLLISKWRPLHILSYGQNVEAFISATPRFVADD